MGSHRWLVVGFGLVLGLRLIYVLFFVPNAIDTLGDGLSYDNIARNVLAGIGYWDTTGERPGVPLYADPSRPTINWPPVYPLFIAGVYRTFGESYTVYLAQAVLGLGIAVFVYLLAECTVEKRAATWAVFLYAVDPFSISISGSFKTETLFTFLIIASIYCFIKMAEDRTTRLSLVILFGISAGVAALTKSVAGLMFGGLNLGVLLGWEARQIRFGKRFSHYCCCVCSVSWNPCTVVNPELPTNRPVHFVHTSLERALHGE